MTNDSAIDDEDFSADLVDPEIENKIPSPLEYAPWHKPRKQFVRVEQWERHSKGMLERLRNQNHFVGGVPFKYLTLPGPELLDIQLVASICAGAGIKLHYTGFCSASDEEQERLRKNVSQFAYDFRDEIAEGSHINTAALEDIVRPKSEARTALHRGGPYDVINIDACKPLLRVGANVAGRLLDAIRCIIEYQIAERTNPWIVLLTTPVQVDDIATESKSAINAQIALNSEQDEDFASKLSEKMSEGEDLTAFLERLGSEDGLDFVRIITLGISKWFIHLGEQANFRVKKLTGYCYSMFREEPFHPNMISVCYLFEKSPITIQDDTGLTNNPEPQPATTPPISDHIRALEKSFAIETVDQLLARDHPRYEELVVQSMDALRRVGFPVDDDQTGYRRWLENEPSHAFVLSGNGD